MSNAKITKRLVDAEKPGPKDRFVWDTEVRGFGLKITPKRHTAPGSRRCLGIPNVNTART